MNDRSWVEAREDLAQADVWIWDFVKSRDPWTRVQVVSLMRRPLDHAVPADISVDDPRDWYERFFQ